MNGVALAIPSKKASFMRYEEKKVFIDNMLKQVEDVPVEHVIGRRISLKRNGNHFSGFCPFHTSSSKKLGSFMVTPGKNIWKCFACGDNYGGNAVKFVMLYENKNYLDACFQIALEESIISQEEYLLYDNENYEKSFIKTIEKQAQTAKPFKKYNSPADKHLLHNVYQAFKNCCTLSAEHKKQLVSKRKLNEQHIEKDYFSFPSSSKKNQIVHTLLKSFSQEEILTIPGFYWDIKKQKLTFVHFKGIGILIRDTLGMIQAIQIRKDTIAEGESRYIWFSSSFAASNPEKYKGGCSCGSPKDVMIPDNDNPKEILCITEGRFKAEKLIDYRNMAISLQGVTSWKGIEGVVSDIRNRHNIRKIFLAFDADAFGNTAVFDNLEKLGKCLSSFRIPIFVMLWRIEYGKGIDDVIISGNLNHVIYLPFEELISKYHIFLQIVLEAYGLEEKTEIRKLPINRIENFRNDLQMVLQESLNLP